MIGGNSSIEALNQTINEFGLGRLIDFQIADDGVSQNITFLSTAKGKFVAKRDELPAQLELYSEVEKLLNRNGIRQPRISRSKDGRLKSSVGISIYEFIDGRSSEHPSTKEFLAFVEYLARYNQVIRAIEFPELLDDLPSGFDQAGSLEFLFSKVEPAIDSFGLNRDTLRVAKTTFDLLHQLKHVSPEDRQLVHVDPCPGNVLYQDGSTAALIDFSPGWETHYYPLAVALHYHLYIFNNFRFDRSMMQRSLEKYLPVFNAPFQGKAFFECYLKAVSKLFFMPLVFRVTAKSLTTWQAKQVKIGVSEEMALGMKSVIEERTFLEHLI